MNKVEKNKYIKAEYKALKSGICVMLLSLVMMLILGPYPGVAGNTKNPVKVSGPKKIKGVKSLPDIRKEEKLKGSDAGKKNKRGKSLENSGGKMKQKKLLRKTKETRRKERAGSEAWQNKKGALDKRQVRAQK